MKERLKQKNKIGIFLFSSFLPFFLGKKKKGRENVRKGKGIECEVHGRDMVSCYKL